MKIYFVSLGCDKNLCDSEAMLALLVQHGHEIVRNKEEAEVAIVNTCCFIHDAKEESIETILELASCKKTGLKKLLITGCLAQRYQEEIFNEMEEVDGILGATNIDEILQLLDATLSQDHVLMCKSPQYMPQGLTDRISSSLDAYAYLKIAEGCSKRCTYCIIPHVRGNYRSIPMEEIMETARKLAKKGIKELILVAQETTVYGMDLYGEKRLPELLRQLSTIEGIQWLRVLYCYPEEINDELIQEMASNPKVCHYIDMPIQHCENSILKAMGRRTTKEQIMEVVLKLRQNIPDMIIRTTLISGFPGETEKDHEALMEFVDLMGFDRLGVFPYSPEEGTRAYELPDQIEEEVKLRRVQEIMELQQEVSTDNNQDRIGEETRVLITGYIPEENVYVGRSYGEVPEVDGYIFVHAQEEIISGEMVNVRIINANTYDLIGEVIYESAK